MAQPAVSYDRRLPEIPGRRPWEAPTSYLVKDPATPDGWRVETSGRRPSDLQLVPAIRRLVDQWRDQGYPGSSELTRELFLYWFEDEHAVAGFDVPLRYHFAQREAIETLVWLIEVARAWDAANLVQRFARRESGGLPGILPAVETGADGRRKVRWKGGDGVVREQDLPPSDLRRYAFRMATGSGKTWVMAMAVVWSHLHRRLVPKSPVSTNFLIVAPNVIVYERLRKDFEGNRIFRRLPLIPLHLRQHFDQRVILRGEPTSPAESGNLFLTNIQQLYERKASNVPDNPVQAMLGPRPGLGGEKETMLDRITTLPDLIVLNDEAHHVHDEDLQWTKTLRRIHRALPAGLAGWLDFSATPKDSRGQFFPWVVCDYPLAQAVEDRIVKAPVMVEACDADGNPLEDPERVTAKDAPERYRPWLRAAVQRFRAIESALQHVPTRPILFVLATIVAHAKAISRALTQDEFGFSENEVLTIHTDRTGAVSGNQRKLDELRRAARDVDDPRSGLKVIVSVLMLREGWDVRNVAVVLGLRPFTARSDILPEQVIGRGLRLMRDLGPERTQTVEVLGTTRLLETVRGQLEVEGVGMAVVRNPLEPPVTIRPVQDRSAYDITLPDLAPDLRRDPSRLLQVDIGSLPPVRIGIPEPLRENLRAEFATTGTHLHEETVSPPTAAAIEDSLTRIARSVESGLGLPTHFAILYPMVRSYVSARCFGCPVNLSSRELALGLSRSGVRDAVADLLVRELGKRTIIEPRAEPLPGRLRLFDTRPFTWRRDLPPLQTAKTVFNYVATYNDFERRFAEFLDRLTDVLRFAALAATEQGSAGVQFRIPYLKGSGAIGHYYPDWVIVASDGNEESFWIIETKGREFAGTRTKDAAARRWCARATRLTGEPWSYKRVNQPDFDAVAAGAKSFSELLARCC